MNQDQIDRIAREYAESKGIRDEWTSRELKAMAEPILEWLCKKYLIVEKSRADALWDASQLNSGMYQHDEVVQADAVADTLKYLFPETFNQEEQ